MLADDEVVLLPAILFARCAFGEKKIPTTTKICWYFGFLNWLMLMLIRPKIPLQSRHLFLEQLAVVRVVILRRHRDGQSEQNGAA